MPIIVKIRCASTHEPDQHTIQASQFPSKIERAIDKATKHTVVILEVRPKGTRINWYWAWQVNRTERDDRSRSITTRTKFSDDRMILPTTIGEFFELEVKSVAVVDGRHTEWFDL